MILIKIIRKNCSSTQVYGNWLKLEPKAVRVPSELWESTAGHLLVVEKVDVSEIYFQV